MDLMSTRPNKSLQATGAAPSVLDGVGDSLLPGLVAALFPAPVPELGRKTHEIASFRPVGRDPYGVRLWHENIPEHPARRVWNVQEVSLWW